MRASRLQPSDFHGFTLVEVTLALGLFSYVLISLLALLPISLDSARNAVEITRAAKVSELVISDLAQSRFSNVTALAGSNFERTFDYDGIPTKQATNTYFTVSGEVHSSTVVPGAEAASGHLARVSLKVKTPTGATALSTVSTITDKGY